ncbi:MFS transporter [Naasia aerilata]|uniref:MFS transporter n=1 Tax=Naasia aerilata TaxID=1162966 RepID=A0ABM8G9L9_9MICO|nr:MFS transporter [Naasia aerilata]BDZ44898.1 MFS transporter [Naasia aerilata]
MATERIPLRTMLGLGSLTLCAFLAITTEVLPVGLLPQLSRDLRVDAGTAGLLVTVYALAVAILAVPVALATSRLPRKAMLLGAIAGYGLSNLTIAVGPTFALVCLGRGIGGLAHAIFFSVVSAYASHLVAAGQEGRAIAIAFSGNSLGFLLGVPLATSLGAALGWRAAFGMVAEIAALLVLVTLALLPPVSPTPVEGGATLRSWWDSGLVIVAVATALGFVGNFTFYTYVSVLLVDRGVPESAVGPVLFLLGAAGVVGLWVAGLTVDRVPRLALLALLAATTASLTVLALLTASPVATIVAAAFWSAASGSMATFWATASIRTRVVSADLAAAVNNSMSNVGIASGAALGALAYGVGGVGFTLPIAAGLVAATLVLVALARRAFPAGRPPAATVE